MAPLKWGNRGPVRGGGLIKKIILVLVSIQKAILSLTPEQVCFSAGIA